MATKSKSRKNATTATKSSRSTIPEHCTWKSIIQMPLNGLSQMRGPGLAMHCTNKQVKMPWPKAENKPTARQTTPPPSIKERQQQSNTADELLISITKDLVQRWAQVSIVVSRIKASKTGNDVPRRPATRPTKRPFPDQVLHLLATTNAKRKKQKIEQFNVSVETLSNGWSTTGRTGRVITFAWCHCKEQQAEALAVVSILKIRHEDIRKLLYQWGPCCSKYSTMHRIPLRALLCLFKHRAAIFVVGFSFTDPHKASLAQCRFLPPPFSHSHKEAWKHHSISI